MYDGCFKIDFKIQKKNLKISYVCMMDVLKLILNFKKKKCKNIQYEGCLKIDLNFQKIKLKIFNMMDVLKLILNLKK